MLKEELITEFLEAKKIKELIKEKESKEELVKERKEALSYFERIMEKTITYRFIKEEIKLNKNTKKPIGIHITIECEEMKFRIERNIYNSKNQLYLLSPCSECLKWSDITRMVSNRIDIGHQLHKQEVLCKDCRKKEEE